MEKKHGALWDSLTETEVKLMRIDGQLTLRSSSEYFSHKLNMKKEMLINKRAKLSEELDLIAGMIDRTKE